MAIKTLYIELDARIFSTASYMIVLDQIMWSVSSREKKNVIVRNERSTEYYELFFWLFKTS